MLPLDFHLHIVLGFLCQGPKRCGCILSDQLYRFLAGQINLFRSNVTDDQGALIDVIANRKAAGLVREADIRIPAVPQLS